MNILRRLWWTREFSYLCLSSHLRPIVVRRDVSVLLHQSLHALLRVFLVAVGQVADAETHCSARDVQHGLCVRTPTAKITTRGGHQLECKFSLLLISGYLLAALLYRAVNSPPNVKNPHVRSISPRRQAPRNSSEQVSLLRSVSRIGTETEVSIGRGSNMARDGGVFALSAVVVLLLNSAVVHSQLLPVVINTWPFVNANYKGTESSSALLYISS